MYSLPLVLHDVIGAGYAIPKAPATTNQLVLDEDERRELPPCDPVLALLLVIRCEVENLDPLAVHEKPFTRVHVGERVRFRSLHFVADHGDHGIARDARIQLLDAPVLARRGEGDQRKTGKYNGRSSDRKMVHVMELSDRVEGAPTRQYNP